MLSSEGSIYRSFTHGSVGVLHDVINIKEITIIVFRLLVGLWDNYVIVWWVLLYVL